ncbi:MAG: putative transcriptional regulator, TetR family [Moraxellaceae bacterium]|jgi:AcrR family transcriptional regulator|nr:putative transcriptional regulator, TetR family [Moraxellaceae bacterium]
MTSIFPENVPRRGRPPKTETQLDQVRDRILTATRTVFARVGYHALSVELVLAEAGVSRPTFYKYFPSLDDVLERLLTEVNEDLITRLLGALVSVEAPFAKVEAAVLAWRQWGEDLGDFLRPFFAELHNPTSPVGHHRQRTLGLLTGQVATAVELLGRERPSPLRVATFLNGVEYLGYHYHLNTPRDAASWQETREAMFRLALGLLGEEGDWGNAPALAREFDIHLNGR